VVAPRERSRWPAQLLDIEVDGGRVPARGEEPASRVDPTSSSSSSSVMNWPVRLLIGISTPSG
jgi:hypothetical protein